MASGYIEYAVVDGAVLNTTSFTGVAMTTPALPNANDAIPLPTSGARWSHVEISMISTAGSNEPEGVQFFLSWDSGGEEIIAGPSTTITTVTPEATAGTFSCAFDLGIVPTYPAGTTIVASGKARGTVYCWIRPTVVDGSNTKVQIARLHWHELSKG